MTSQYEPSITPEMKARYVARRREDLVKLEHALETNDTATLKSIAHQIKGNASTFSYDDLEKSAIALEVAAEAADFAASADAIAQMRAWLSAQS